MEIVIIIILTIIAILLGYQNFVNQRNIKIATDELRQINSIETNLQIKLYAPDKNFESLLQEVNSLLEIKQKNNILHIRREKELREQIVNISHDLRTPLTSILGYIELMRDATYTDDEKMQYLDVIENRSKVLQMLITSFYDLSRLEADEYEFYYESLNLHNILCEIIAAFYNNFTEKKFDVVISLDENIPEIIADKKAVIRIFTNLLQNALTHGLTKVNVSQKLENNKIITIIRNDVKDFTQDDLTQIFERFFTADKTRNAQSTGLGLTIVKKFVDEMGSKIYADLNNDVFSITIEWKIK